MLAERVRMSGYKAGFMQENYFLFGGLGDYITQDSFLLATPTFSIAFHMRLDNTSSTKFIISNRTSADTGLSILLRGSGLTIDFGGTAGRWDTGFNPPVGMWVHVTIIRTSSYTQVLVNGEEFITRNGELGFVSNPSDVVNIGRSGDGRLPYFGGLFNISVWDKVLSASDIRRSMNSNIRGNESGLRIYWKFNSLSETGYNRYGVTLESLEGEQFYD